MGTVWTPDEEQVLRRLHADGLTRQVMAERIPGKTRNAIIGKLNRMGLITAGLIHTRYGMRKAPTPPGGRGRSILLPCGARPTEKRAPTHLGAAPPSLHKFTPVDTTAAIDLLERDDCRWPIGNAKEKGFRFCCEPQAPSSSYCPAHRTQSRSDPEGKKHGKDVKVEPNYAQPRGQRCGP